ncbi:MAG: exonuclease SbcCD subunit D [Candidatus Nanopelagicales bacterium]
MRILHTSDWHLGRSFHGASLHEDQVAFVDWLVSVTADEAADLVVIAGDVYDRAVPPLESVHLWQSALERLSELAPVLVTSGNHDSPTRLGFAGSLLGRAGVHLRTGIDLIDAPLRVTGRDGVEVAAYGIPYLEPDLQREALGAERSHTAVLTSAMDRIRADLSARDGLRSVVVAHAFITGSGEAVVSESERDLRVGGVGDAPASVFAGVDYVALGHLHGAQEVRAPGATRMHYSGSPLAFSFSEESHVKSVTLIDVDAAGVADVSMIPVPVGRPLITLRGDLDTLLQDQTLRVHAESWVRVILTDERRPDHAMSRLRDVWPYTVDLDFDARRPANDSPGPALGLASADPVLLAQSFVEHVTATPPTPEESAALQRSVEAVRIGEVPE